MQRVWGRTYVYVYNCFCIIACMQLSCTSSSNELTDRSRFPRHFQFSTSGISLAYGFFGVIQKFKWRKVTIITQDENLFTVVTC